jgi:zinc/manganese transport system ATP-binding protein
MLDEPLTDVDAGKAKLLLSVIEDWHTEGRTVIAVLHDMTVVRRHFPHTRLLGGLPLSGIYSGMRNRTPDCKRPDRSLCCGA